MTIEGSEGVQYRGVVYNSKLLCDPYLTRSTTSVRGPDHPVRGRNGQWEVSCDRPSRQELTSSRHRPGSNPNTEVGAVRVVNHTSVTRP